ncbi:MAG TPA: potassium channel family protein [Syntrophorhabdales bacterium]|nr:potassium channel family protein [Syntrophorhabdales bacterium]
MRVLAGLAGIVIIVIILWDAFETIILPRRVTRRFRLTRLFYRYTWLPFSKLLYAITSETRTENLLSFYGPISLLLLLIIWAGGLIFGFGLLQYAAGSALHLSEGTPGLATDLYLSGTNFFTLGLGDVYPRTTAARALTVLEAGMGLGFLALIIGYLPALNQSFSRRETNISMLDERAGSPSTASEMIRRNVVGGSTEELQRLLAEWEEWSAELLESHLSYPFLAYFRSHHENQSWLGALTTVLDTTALVSSMVEGALQRQAWMTFAVARHAVVDLAIVFGISPAVPQTDRLSAADMAKLTRVLTASGLKLQAARSAQDRLSELRRMYEPYILSLASYFCLDAPPWVSDESLSDNWESSAWERSPGHEHPGRHF